jgi:hypothetical protein
VGCLIKVAVQVGVGDRPPPLNAACSSGLHSCRWRRWGLSLQSFFIVSLCFFDPASSKVFLNLCGCCTTPTSPTLVAVLPLSMGFSSNATPTYNPHLGPTRPPPEEATGVLNELGGLAELEEVNGSFIIRGYSYPLTGVAPSHPEVCRMAHTLLAELSGVPVHEACHRGERPRCCFEVASFGDNKAVSLEIIEKEGLWLS